MKRKQKFKQAQHRTYVIIVVLALLLIPITLQIVREQQQEDVRAAMIDAYFARYNAPLAGHGHTFVQAADQCNMDWRLLPAIAMQESTGGKRMQYNNPFGWGSAEIPFENFDEAIMHVGSHLCGHVSTTARWYDTTSTAEKLYWYNGTVAPSYPAEVQWIMNQIDRPIIEQE